MTTISDKDRAEAQSMFEAHLGRGDLTALNASSVRRWLAVRDHVLAAHECPTVPVWRPVTRDEIEAGWEVRSRHSDGREGAWGVARRHDNHGDWFTEAGARLTYDASGWSWTYETTAPTKPEPEPWPDELVGLMGDVIGMAPGDHTSWQTARAVLNLLTDRGLIERPKAGA